MLRLKLRLYGTEESYGSAAPFLIASLLNDRVPDQPIVLAIFAALVAPSHVRDVSTFIGQVYPVERWTEQPCWALKYPQYPHRECQ